MNELWKHIKNYASWWNYYPYNFCLFFLIPADVHHFFKSSAVFYHECSCRIGYMDEFQELWCGVYLKALRGKGIHWFSYPCPRRDMFLTSILQVELVRWTLAISNGRYFKKIVFSTSLYKPDIVQCLSKGISNRTKTRTQVFWFLYKWGSCKLTLG